jgi:TonB-linked SusC/RagA family outer membrane protein
MRKILFLFFALFAFMLHSEVSAQQRVITGKVVSEEDPGGLPGASVRVKGTSLGTITDMDGNYTISVPAGSNVLEFSYIGMRTIEETIGNRSVINVTLVIDARQLSEVVVTAIGLEREKKALGYAVSTVSPALIENRPEADLGRVLQGKVPGVNITSTGGVSGTGTNIIIRGYSSVTGSNQPLFVVDGVPFNSNTNQQNGFTQGGQTTSSRFLDLDPNNIESISVLKGLSATVLYGDQGRNGVILVTTKSGAAKRKPAEINLNQSVFENTIASGPIYQNTYGGGFHQNVGFFFSNWGPNFNQIETVRHPIDALQDSGLRNQFPEFHGKTYPYQPYDDPIKAFFRSGLVSNTSVGVSGSSEKSVYNASFGYQNEEGFTPGNTLERYNFGLGMNANLTERLNLNSSFTYAITRMETPPINAGFGSNSAGDIPSIFANVLYTPRSVDLANLPWNAPLDNRSVYFRSGNDIVNPIWAAKNYRNSSEVNRFFNSTSLNYDISDKFAVTYRFGLDTYTENQEIRLNKGGTQSTVINGIYQSINITNTISNSDLIFNYRSEINDDFSVSALLGGNHRYDSYRQDGIGSLNQLAYGLFRHTNFADNSARNVFSGAQLNNTQEERRMGIYSQVTLDYRDYLFFNILARNDWTSTVEPENRRILYPGASVAFIPTDAFENLSSRTLNYLKLRLGYGTSAGFPQPYSTRNILNQNSRAFANLGGTVFPTHSVSTFLGNPNLRPELIKEVEFGFESRMFNNKLTADVSAYEKNVEDLITFTPLDPSTGFTNTAINVGRVRTRGLEIALTGTAVQTNNFSWETTVNWAHYQSIVMELADGLDEVVIAGFTTLGNFAIKDRPFNVIKGQGIARDDKGNKVVALNGQYLAASGIDELGDPNPKFTSSWINNFRYKNFNLSFMAEYRHRGVIYSTTAATMLARGMTKDTDFLRDIPMILPGVKQDGTPNDIMVTSANYTFDNYFFTDEAGIFDGSTVRLREVSLGYDLPANLISRTPFKRASVALSATNLWFRAINMPKYVNFDTDVLSLGVGNGLGFDYLTGPSSRRIGGTVQLTF